MARYDHREIEKRWQERWSKGRAFRTPEQPDPTRKRYVLDMFPYPSSAGLHVGHPEGYTATDIVSRYLRLRGFDVLHPMGWDAFGLPAENFAIKSGKHPVQTTAASIENFRRQIQRLGFSYDWDREVNTSDPAYYRWTQWLFGVLYKKGLAYKKLAPVNWCPNDNTVLANEQVVDGRCERCGAQVVQKELAQWFFTVTAYADELLKDLDALDWPEPIKRMQQNWIGRSEGAEINFTLDRPKRRFVLLHGYRGSPERNFFPWLKQTLEGRGHEVVVPDLPHTDQPTEEEQVRAVLDNVTFDARTVIFGHSLGGVVAMKVAEKLTQPIAGLVLAGSFLQPKFRDVPRPFATTFDWHFDVAKIRRMCPSITVLGATNDYAVPIEASRLLATTLHADYREVESSEKHFCGSEEPTILAALDPAIRVFTTRPDTLFGVTYVVLAPEHPLVAQLTTEEQRKDVEAYVQKARTLKEIERTSTERAKTGVFTGSYAINPANNERVPIWIADYVLGSYGTGAVMAVPAHDDRDCAFARKFNLPLRRVVEPEFIATTGEAAVRAEEEYVPRNAVCAVIRNPKDGTYLCVAWKQFRMHGLVTGGIEDGEDLAAAALREIHEETGYKHLRLVRNPSFAINTKFYHRVKKQNRAARFQYLFFELEDEECDPLSEEDAALHDIVWKRREELDAFFTVYEGAAILKLIDDPEYIHTGEGLLHDSGDFTGLRSAEARDRISAWLAREGKGGPGVQYRLRDWLISRQRYWGAPIPMVYCDEHGEQLVPDEQLPVLLPNDVDFKPTGESPLVRSTSFNSSATCPACGKSARRETDTMDTFVDSAWYFLRYCDPKNGERAFDPEKVAAWLPVDLYVGGAEHAVLHLLYARFIYKALADAGELPKSVGREPFTKLRNQGLILGEDGEKMSKSRGNVVNPDEVVEEYGADAFRLFEMFLGPLEMQKPWSTTGIVGMRRFLERVWETAITPYESDITASHSDRLDQMLHGTIKKVTEDIASFHFNTAISSLMELLNALRDTRRPVDTKTHRETFRTLLILLYPFAPHLASECLERLGIDLTSLTWPTFDASMAESPEVEIAVQVNGKKRATILVPRGSIQVDVWRKAVENNNVKKFLPEKPRKVIFVKDRIINFVV